MKKNLARVFCLVGFLLSIIIILVLNIQTSYLQGINYEIRKVKIPLYLKLLDFFSRDSHYKVLTREIIKGCSGDKEKAMRLLEWTHNNIKKNVEGLPVVDDHAWHIIVRGYGEDDQFNDVFSTLCNYAGMEAFFTWIDSAKKDRKLPLSFVKIKGEWSVFDSFRGVYFSKKNSSEPANIEMIKSGIYSISGIAGVDPNTLDYAPYIINVPLVKDMAVGRSNVQSPFRRLFCEIKKLNIVCADKGDKFK